jgi:hypothetical protein
MTTATPWWRGLRPGTVLWQPPVTLADASVVYNVNESGVLWDPKGQVFGYAGRNVPPYQQAGPALSSTITTSHKAARDRGRR